MNQSVPNCDTCDNRITIPNFSAKQSRFLLAYRQDPVILRAAEMAGVNRCSVYRWQLRPDFTAAMKKASDEHFAAHLVKYRAEQEAKRIRREQRERELRPAKLENLARTRARKRG